jgi:hypothetical protein
MMASRDNGLAKRSFQKPAGRQVIDGSIHNAGGDRADQSAANLPGRVPPFI